MALNRLRHATIVTDSDGDKYHFVFGANAMAAIEQRTKKPLKQALREAFPPRDEPKAAPTDAEPADAAPVQDEARPDINFALVRTLVSCTSVKPVLDDEQAGLLIEDVGLAPLMEVFTNPIIGGKVTGSENPPGASS